MRKVPKIYVAMNLATAKIDLSLAIAKENATPQRGPEMESYVLVGYCNAADGRDEEFNEWYWNHHFKDILDLPGVVSGRRFVPAAAQLIDAPLPFNYLGLFEVQCDDPKRFFDELRMRAASGRMSRSTSVANGSSLVLWSVMSESINVL